MPVVFQVAIPDEQLAKMRESLDPKQYRQATFQAVKRTTGKVATAVKAEVKKHAFVKAKYVNRVIEAKPPQGDPPVGRVRVSQELLPAVAYKVSGGKRSGIRIQVSPDRTPITLRHAFRATMKSGHAGIFARAKHLPTKGPHQGKGRLTPRGFAGRFAIVEQFGPSVLQIVELPEILKKITLDAQAELIRQTNSQLDRFLKPAGGSAGGSAGAAAP